MGCGVGGCFLDGLFVGLVVSLFSLVLFFLAFLCFVGWVGMVLGLGI